jgi:site-specific DNA-methyltransferase (adenine-specific)
MRKLISNQIQKPILKINISDVVVSNLTEALYDYSSREDEIKALVKSISQIGQQQPITVVRNGAKYTVIDGILRLKAIKDLNLNEIDAIVCDFTSTNGFSLSDLIIHHQLRKQKTVTEKLNEVKTLLRIDTDLKNPLRDKKRRVLIITSLLGGKGWARNNVLSLEKILRWEKSSNLDLHLAEKVISNEISINKARETMNLIKNSLYDTDKEAESKIVDGFLKGNYSADKAVNLMKVYNRKKSEYPTTVELHSIEDKNFKIIHGDIEKITLSDLEIDTIFTSPPYYQLIKYGDDPNELGREKTPAEYIKKLADILMKCYERLKDTGSMYINLGETYQGSVCLGITERLTVELQDRGALYIDRLIWKKDSNKPNSNHIKRLTPGYETILHFSKTKDYHFEKFKIANKRKNLRVVRGCKEKKGTKTSFHIQNNYDQFRNVLSENTVSDILTNILTVEINKNRTKHVDGEEVHPATFTSNLPVIPLLISTPKSWDSVIFDPFMGSASCGVTTLLLGFKFVGVELYEKNIQTAQRILSDCQAGFEEDSLNSFMEEIDSSEESDRLPEINQAA